MNRAAREELFKDAERLAYDAIKHSGLYGDLTGAEWDEKSAVWARVILNKLDDLIEAESVEEQEEAAA